MRTWDRSIAQVLARNALLRPASGYPSYILTRRQLSTPVAEHNRHANAAAWRKRPPTLLSNAESHSVRASSVGHNVPLPDSSEANNIAAWLPFFESYIPKPLRAADTPYASFSTTAADLLAKAAENGHDILLYYATQGRGDAMVALALQVVRSCTRPRQFRPRHWMSNITWDARVPIDLTLIRRDFASNFSLPQPFDSPPPLDSLKDQMVLEKQSFDRNAIGQIWKSLGSILVYVVDRSGNDESNIVPRVLQVIAELHHNGHIPDNLYRLEPSKDPLALRQPPIFHIHSTRILTLLSDASFDNQALQASLSSDSGDVAFVPLTADHPHGGPTLRPELWLEMVLWCCVHGGWLHEAATLVHRMDTGPQSKPWKLFDWATTIQKHDLGRSDTEAADVHANSSERTISADVVVAIIDGLLNNNLTEKDVSASRNVIHQLKGILRQNKMSLGRSSWDALMVRLVDAPGVGDDGKMLEDLANLPQRYGTEQDAKNYPLRHHPSGIDPTYIFDGSAAMLGVFHRILYDHIKNRDLQGTLRLLGRLQTITDKNKKLSIEEFFAKLKEARIAETQDDLNVPNPKNPRVFNFSTSLPTQQYPSFFLSVPNRITAALLDLFTDCRADELGRWMIYSTDVDGPMIPKSLYGEQPVASSLIRFAATTDDSALLSKLVAAQSSETASETLLALCDACIKVGNLQKVLEILRMLRAHSMHKWTSADHARLLSTLIGQVQTEMNPQVSAVAQRPACDLFQRLLRGGFGIAENLGFSELESTAGILASANDQLAQLCTEFLSRKADYHVSISTKAFNILLEGIIRTYGAVKGKELWETWCAKKQGEVVSLFLTSTDAIPSVSEQFGLQWVRGGPDALLFHGCIDPDRETIQIILDHAQQEQKDASLDQPAQFDKRSTTSGEDLMQWIAGILNAYAPRINAEAGPAQLQTKSAYSPTTRELWTQLSDRELAKAKGWEQRLRGFAEADARPRAWFTAGSGLGALYLEALARDFGMLSDHFFRKGVRVVMVVKLINGIAVPDETVQETMERLYQVSETEARIKRLRIQVQRLEKRTDRRRLSFRREKIQLSFREARRGVREMKSAWNSFDPALPAGLAQETTRPAERATPTDEKDDPTWKL